MGALTFRSDLTTMIIESSNCTKRKLNNTIKEQRSGILQIMNAKTKSLLTCSFNKSSFSRLSGFLGPDKRKLEVENRNKQQQKRQSVT